MSRRALITGGSGFLGAHLIEALQRRGWSIVAAGRRCPSGLQPNQFMRLSDPSDDISIKEVLSEAKPDTVFHLAGTAETKAIDLLYRINVVFAANLLQQASQMSAPPSFLFAGSAAEYGLLPVGRLSASEDMPCNPTSAYGISKLAQTHHALSARSVGISAVVARIFNPVGRGMPRHLALGAFAEQIAQLGPEGGDVFVGDLTAERDFISASDTARILLDLAGHRSVAGHVVNVCSGKGTSLQAMTETLIAHSGKKVSLVIDPARGSSKNTQTRFVGDPTYLHSLGIAPADQSPCAMIHDLQA